MTSKFEIVLFLIGESESRAGEIKPGNEWPEDEWYGDEDDYPSHEPQYQPFEEEVERQRLERMERQVEGQRQDAHRKDEL